MKKIILLIIGSVSLTLGAIGIILPVIPTTPFVLLSAGCFSASSPKLAARLKKSKFFGSYIENYQSKTGIPRKIKCFSIVYLWVGLIISMYFISKPIIILLLFVIGISVTIHILTLKPRG